MEMFQAIWPESSILTEFPGYSVAGIDQGVQPVYALGKILQRGKAGITTRYPNSLIPYTKRIFHCFGDPSMQMYTAIPQKIKVSKNSVNPYSKTSHEVQASIILKDGSVLVATGTEFNFSPYIDKIDKVTYSGHNLIPSDGSNDNILIMAKEEGDGISNIEIASDCLIITYNADEDSKTMLRVRAINNSTTNNLLLQCNGSGSETISTSGFSKGIYVIELIKDGELIDSQKVLI